MDNLDEIKQQLKEINESIQSHRTEWKATIQEYNTDYQKAKAQQQKYLKKFRFAWVYILILILILLYLPTFINSTFRCRQSDPEMDLFLNYIGYSADTLKFDGRYEIDEECLNAMAADLPAGADNAEETKKVMLDLFRQQYTNMTLKEGVLLCGKDLVQEFRMRGDINEAGEFVGGALWHEDIHDPGDACIVNVKLKLENDKLYFFYTPLGESFDRPIVFKKR